MYVCALRPRGEALSRADVFGYIARLQRRDDESLNSIVDGPFAAVATSGPNELRPQLARWRSLVAAGDVRLDNRREVAELAGVRLQETASDLQLVLAAMDQVGEGCIPRILGDFAFVVWDPHAQKLLAVRDAFGVKPLYQRDAPGLLLFASEVGPLQHDEAYDLDYIRAQLTSFSAPVHGTIWQGISLVQPGGLVRQRGTVRTAERYWRADEFVPAPDGDEATNCFRFRELLEEGVRTRVANAGDVWAYLSGGLDSSSVVAMANMVQSSGARLGGTVTFVDTLGDGDERAYSDAVVQKYQLRNEQLRNYWPWQDDGAPPPATDHPTPMYPFFARERRMLEVVQGAGSNVLLSGMGADHYLSGSLDYITDLVSRRELRSAVGEVTRWSVATRTSFWRLGRRYLLDPFLPAGLQARSGAEPPPPWLAAGLMRNGIEAGPVRLRPAGGRFGERVTTALATLPAWFERWPSACDVEVRYPFLYRPLVEWSLRLPATQRLRPFEAKWILREATRDVLPEKVRTRSTKGGIDGRILWALNHEKRRLDALLHDPILGQLGCIDPVRLRREVERARRGVPVHNANLFCALSLETWLAVRNGQWDVVPRAAATAA